MKNKYGSRIMTLLLTLLFLFFAIGVESNSVTVIPNESFIEGIVLEYAIISSHLIGIKPRQILYRLTITIESSEQISDKPNFLDNKVGQNIQFYTKEELSPKLFGKKIKAKARYTGDERGGLYWIKDINIIEGERNP